MRRREYMLKQKDRIILMASVFSISQPSTPNISGSFFGSEVFKLILEGFLLEHIPSFSLNYRVDLISTSYREIRFEIEAKMAKMKQNKTSSATL